MAARDPVYLGRLLRNRVVLVAGDSVSKNLASSLTCIVDAAPRTGLQTQRVSVKGMSFYATKVPAVYCISIRVTVQ